MGKLRYLVLAPDGERKEMEVEARDDASARRQLRRQQLRVIRSLETKANRRSERSFDVYIFTNRLAPLLQANIPLEQALSVIEAGGSADRRVVRELRKGLHEGKRFSQLIQEMPQHFPALYASLIETGEEAGCLPEVTIELRRFLKENREFRSFILTSSIYPLTVIAVTLTVVILLFTVFIPRFARIFEELGRSMPWLTRTMLEIGNFMQAIWWFWPLLVFSGWIVFRRSRQEGRLRRWKDRWLLKIPLLGRIIAELQVERFIRTMSTMVRNHVHLLPAVRIARRVITNEVIRESFAGVERELRGGQRLSEILDRSPYMLVGGGAMLKIAEESGELGRMLDQIALEAEENTRTRIKQLLALLEPIIILLLALLVLLVVLSVFLAIMEMNVIK